MNCRLLPVVGVLVLAGCAMPDSRSDGANVELDRALAGRTAGRPQPCINTRGAGPLVIDRDTVLFRVGKRVWRTEIAGGCPGITWRSTLVIEPTDLDRYCRNDRFRAIDGGMSIPAATCRFGSFVPYDKR